MMTRFSPVRTALAALALLAGSIVAHAAPSRSAASARRAAGSVSALSIVPNAGKTEVIIAVDGEVDVSDFTLSSPHRVVLDLRNAVLAGAPTLYDKIVRGGITNVRLAQFKVDVVRLVLEMDGPHGYQVARGDGTLRILVEGGSAFTAWSSLGAGAPASESRSAATESRSAAAAEARALALDARSQQRTTMMSAAPGAMAPPAHAPRARTAAAPQPRMTVTYQDADIKEVIAAFAAFARRTIIVGKAVSGQVTAEIVDKPWDVALQAILKSQGLDAQEDSTGIITVDSYQNLLAKQAAEPLATQMIKLNYANATSIRATITSLLSRDCSAAASAGGGAAAGQACVVRGAVVSDSGTNSLLITDVPSRLPDLIGFARDLDFRTPQVAIRAKIIFVNRSRIEDIGLRYDIRTRNQFSNAIFPALDSTGTALTNDRIVLGGAALTGVGNANARVPNPTLSLVFSTAMGAYFITPFLEALRENQLADVQAEPSIVTLDNRPANIFSGQEIPFRVVDAGSGGAGGGSLPRATTRTTEAGITLTVTPHITNNRQILMTLSAENSDAQIAASDVGFIINRQRANNQLLVSDGETAVIGGLTVTTVYQVRQGIPLLMDIPIIGRLFQRESKTESKRDLLILVTPHILDEGERLPPGPSR